MDYVTAFVEIVKALAWPVSALMMLRMFREPLLELVPYIHSLKVAGLELTVKKEIEEVKQLSLKSLEGAEAPKVISTVAPDRKATIYQIAEMYPSAAISEAWRELESAGVNAVGRLCPSDLPSNLKARVSFGEALRTCGLISRDQMSAISKLRKIRNESVHLPNFTLDSNVARDYVDTAFSLAEELNGLTPGS
jgi:hypothetical protein